MRLRVPQAPSRTLRKCGSAAPRSGLTAGTRPAVARLAASAEPAHRRDLTMRSEDRSAATWRGPTLRQSLLAAQRRGDRLVEPGDDGRRGARGREDAEPRIAAVLAVARLAQGRDVGELRQAAVAHRGQAAQPLSRAASSHAPARRCAGKGGGSVGKGMG